MKPTKRVLPRTGELVWQVRYRDLQGTRRSKQFPTKREADAFMLTVGVEKRDGIHVADRASITIAQASDVWLTVSEGKHLEPTTLESYRRHVKLHILPRIGHYKLSQFTHPIAQEFCDTTFKEWPGPLSHAVVSSLSMILNSCMKRGHVAYNAASNLDRPSRDRFVTGLEFPTFDEIKTLLNAESDDDYLRPFVHVGLLCGLRSSEMRGLKWENVVLTDKGAKIGAKIEVRQRASRGNKLGALKSKAGKRDIPMGPSLVSVLREWKLKQPIEQRKLDLVFPNRRGGISAHQNSWRHFAFLQTACGMVAPKLGSDGTPMIGANGRPLTEHKYGPHAMRHAFAALLIKQQGKQAKEVQYQLGHASIKMTYDVYGYLFKDEESGARDAEELERSLGLGI